VGSWTVGFEDPRPSIFSSIQLCPQYGHYKELTEEEAKQRKCPRSLADAAGLAETETKKSPNQVLAVQLVNGTGNLGTLLGYLKQQDWWAASQKVFLAGKVDDQAIRDFCRDLKNEAAKLQLNKIDGGIIAVAIRDAAILPSAVTDKMTTAPDCGYAAK
ncbi:MAG: hypothetical protein ACRD9W_13875, partial [Terriglobia bacterium]